MPRTIISVIRAGDLLRRFLRVGFILNLNLLILMLPTRMAYPSGNLSQSQPSSHQSIESNHSASQNLNDARMLEASKSIERELAGGEVHAYQLALTAGQYVRVVVDQRRINIALAAFDPENKKIVESDGFGIGELELVSFVAETSAIYRLEVLSFDKAAPKGSYEIKIEALREATEQDKSQVPAENLIAARNPVHQS